MERLGKRSIRKVMEMMEEVTIVGMGALGILYGDILSKGLGADKVRFLADGARLDRCRREGAWHNGVPCDFRFTDGSDGPAQLLIFATKGPALEEAMALAGPCVGEDTVILSLLNGVTSEETLGLAFGQEKVLYAVAQGMDAVREGSRLTCTHEGVLYLGVPQEDYFDRGEKLEEVYQLLRRGGVNVEKEEDILHRMWCKFMLNVGINQVCMAYECDYGGAQVPGEVRDTMIAAMNEARKVGACQGVLVTQKDLKEYVALMDSLDPKARPSMAQDGLAHRPSEVELFAGTVLELADFYGMQAPANRKLYDWIKEMETNW